MGLAGRLRGFLVDALAAGLFGGGAECALSGGVLTFDAVFSGSADTDVAGASFLKIFLSALSTAFSYK